MARAIDVRYCKHCGQLESMRSTEDEMRDCVTIEVGCNCGVEPARRIVLPRSEPYYLRVEVKMKGEERHDDPDPGDVQTG